MWRRSDDLRRSLAAGALADVEHLEIRGGRDRAERLQTDLRDLVRAEVEPLEAREPRPFGDLLDVAVAELRVREIELLERGEFVREQGWDPVHTEVGAADAEL